MSLPSFGQVLDREFNRLASQPPPPGKARGEVFLFRQLQAALVGASLAPHYIVEEFHGTRQQVFFPTTPALMLSPGRCELCDLMIITFSDAPLAMRLTFFQAKYERQILPIAAQPATVRVVGNLMQWDLLSNRPLITPCYSTFSPPTNLLQGAFPSIGTFGFFHDAKRGPTSLLYCAAPLLQNATAPGRRYGVLDAPAPAKAPSRRVGRQRELLSAVDTIGFGDGLAAMQIGSPLEPDRTSSDDSWRTTVRKWLRPVLPSLSAKGTLGGVLATHLGLVLDGVGQGGTVTIPRLNITPSLVAQIAAQRDMALAALDEDLDEIKAPPVDEPPASSPPGSPSSRLPRSLLIYVSDPNRQQRR